MALPNCRIQTTSPGVQFGSHVGPLPPVPVELLPVLLALLLVAPVPPPELDAPLDVTALLAPPPPVLPSGESSPTPTICAQPDHAANSPNAMNDIAAASIRFV